MSDCCSHCGEDFGYEPGWDDPPKGEGHIEVTFNPADEPSYVVGEMRNYCSAECLLAELDELPFNEPDGGIPESQDTDSDRSGHRLDGALPDEQPAPPPWEDDDGGDSER